MQKVYFDGSSDRPLRIDLLQGLTEPLVDQDESPAQNSDGWRARIGNPNVQGAWSRSPGRPQEHAGGPWDVFEIVVALVLAALAAPAILLYRREMVTTLFLEAILTPLTRRTRYAALVHLAMLTALLLHLRGHSDVTVVFCAAMLAVYVDSLVLQRHPHCARRRRIKAMYCAISAVQIAISVSVSNQTLRVVNASCAAALALHFALIKGNAGSPLGDSPPRG